MVKFSPIAPIALLQQLHYQGELGDYLLLLAHDVLDYPIAYQKLIDAVKDQNPDAVIILDNSTVELGHPLSAASLQHAATVCRANVLALPDVIGDADATKLLICKTLDEMRATNLDLMAIPQGQSVTEFTDLIDWMDDFVKPQWYGIPRWVANTFHSRTGLIDYINNTVDEPKIHLLGMSKYFDDDIHCCFMNNVQGIDSANPMVLGQSGFELGVDGVDGIVPHMDRGDFWEHISVKFKSVSNIHYVRELISV